MSFYKNITGMYLGSNSNLEDGKRYVIDLSAVKNCDNIYVRDFCYKYRNKTPIVEIKRFDGTPGSDCHNCIFHTQGTMMRSYCIAGYFNVPACAKNMLEM